MTLLSRNQVKSPELRKQTISVPSLGGDVVVRALMLSELMEVREIARKEAQPGAGESDDQAKARAGARVCAFTLAKAVCLADGAPLYTAQEWEVFGADHVGEALQLFEVTQQLNGQRAGDVEKN